MLICYILILFHTRIEKKWSGHQFLYTHAVMMDADLVATSQDFFIALSKVYLFIYLFILKVPLKAYLAHHQMLEWA